MALNLARLLQVQVNLNELNGLMPIKILQLNREWICRSPYPAKLLANILSEHSTRIREYLWHTEGAHRTDGHSWQGLRPTWG